MPRGEHAAGSLFARIAAAPDTTRPAVGGPGRVPTYRQLLDRAAHLASRLGTSAGPVLLYGHKEPAMIVGVVASLRAGRTYVPVDQSTPPARIARMLAAARPDHAVLAREPAPGLGAELAARGIDTIALDPLASNVTAASDTPSPPAPEAAEAPS